MNSIIDFINQPIVISLITITVGGYLLNLISDRRSMNDKLRDKSIEFITNAGNNINVFFHEFMNSSGEGNLKSLRK